MDELEKRSFPLNSIPLGNGSVIYWMTREIRSRDNHALLYAQSLACKTCSPLKTVFCFADSFLNAGIRQYSFLARGLAETFESLSAFGIECAVLAGDPVKEVVRYLEREKAGALICDTAVLKIQMEWRDAVVSSAGCMVVEVDSRCIVPARIASGKREYGAYTIRPKIKALLPDYLCEPPVLQRQGPAVPLHFDAERFLSQYRFDRSVSEVEGILPGEKAARSALDLFLSSGLRFYSEKSSDPNEPALSRLSPYLHFGMISSLRAALACDSSTASRSDIDSFLEQLIVRRELAENFCRYVSDYDSHLCYPHWAAETLDAHRADPRDYIYSLSEFESASTHDPLWNAAQRELLSTGKIHSYMRMYWAKKILEWSPSYEAAHAAAVFLNDRWALDGRDPNGYAGIAWSIGGVHDRAWGERPVFGKIRFMSASGCARKFDASAYIKRWQSGG